MFNRYKLYTVHLHPDAVEPYETLKFIPESFSWGGFVFNGLWLLYHRLWFLGIVFFIGIVLLSLLGAWFPAHMASFTIIRMVLCWYIGLQGHDMVRAALRKQGYLLVDVVAADSLIEAQQRFLDRRLQYGFRPAPLAAAMPSMYPERA